MNRMILVLAGALALPISLSSQETMAGFLQEEYSCIMCHTEMRLDFLEGVHSDRGIQCTDCHGGDPSKFETAEAHSSGFSGALTKVQSVELCLSCHGEDEKNQRIKAPKIKGIEEHVALVSEKHSVRIDLERTEGECIFCHDPHSLE